MSYFSFRSRLTIKICFNSSRVAHRLKSCTCVRSSLARRIKKRRPLREAQPQLRVALLSLIWRTLSHGRSKAGLDSYSCLSKISRQRAGGEEPLQSLLKICFKNKTPLVWFSDKEAIGFLFRRVSSRAVCITDEFKDEFIAQTLIAVVNKAIAGDQRNFGNSTEGEPLQLRHDVQRATSHDGATGGSTDPDGLLELKRIPGLKKEYLCQSVRAACRCERKSVLTGRKCSVH